MTANVPAEAKPETTERQTPEQIASENEVARTAVTELDQAATEPAPALTPPPVAAAAPVEDKKPAEVVRAKSAREEQLERIEANRQAVIKNESGMITPEESAAMVGQTLRPGDEAAPPAEPAPAAAPAVPATAAPPAEPMVRLIVDGHEIEMTQSQANANAQMYIATKVRLNESKRILAQARRFERGEGPAPVIPENEGAGTPPAPSAPESVQGQVTKPDFAEMARKLQMGTEEEAAAVLENVFAAAQTRPENVTPIVEAVFETKEQYGALESIGQHYLEVLDDRFLVAGVGAEINRLKAEETATGQHRAFGNRVALAFDRIHTKYLHLPSRLNGGTPAGGNPQPSTARPAPATDAAPSYAVLDGRRLNKLRSATPVISSAAVPMPSPPTPQSASAAIAEIRKSRGQKF